MSTRFCAFLRGVNLGGRRVTNEELCGAVEGPDLTHVAAYRASGNLVFTPVEAASPGELEALLERRIADALDFGSTTFVRPMTRLSRVLEAPVLARADEGGFKAHVLFLKEDAALEVTRRLAALESQDDRFEVLGTEVIWLRRGGLHDAPIQPGDLTRAVGSEAYTQRTVGTVDGLLRKYGPPQP